VDAQKEPGLSGVTMAARWHRDAIAAAPGTCMHRPLGGQWHDGGSGVCAPGFAGEAGHRLMAAVRRICRCLGRGDGRTEARAVRRLAAVNHVKGGGAAIGGPLG
jgi:hypothetical protein